MDAQSIAQFFSRVVPWPQSGQTGVINLHWFSPEHYVLGRPYTSLKEFMGMAQWCHRNPDKCKEVYYCLSQQSQVGPKIGKTHRALRNHQNATFLKAIWLDVDVKEPPKGYESVDDAINAINAFVEAAGLPYYSALVLSGGGVHVYWISDRALSTADWQPYANGLRALAERHGLRCDLSVTVDSARILRVPGTYNRKTGTPRPVILSYLSQEDINFQDTLGHIRVAGTPTRQPVREPTRKLVLFDEKPRFKDTSDGWEAEIGTPSTYGTNLDPLPLFREGGCPFLQNSFRVHGKGVKQDLWMLTGLACTFMEGGREVFHTLSNEYDTYQEEETEAMFERKDAERESKDMGWPHCSTFEGWGAKECKTCPHHGRIVSPLNLTRPAPGVSDPLAAPLSGEPAEQDNPLHLPYPYFVDEKTRCISLIVSKPIKNGSVDELVKVFSLEVTDPWHEFNVDGMYFTAHYGNRKIKVWIPLTVIVNPQKLEETLAQSHITCGISGVQLKTFMRTWIEKLKREVDAMDSVPYGWWDNDDLTEHGFAYDDMLYTPNHPDGIRRTGAGDPETRADYKSKGKIEPWLAALKTVTDQHRPALEAIVALSFAAPLMKLTGHSGVTLSAIGQPAANKSSAVAVGLAVWGNPEKTKRRAGSSAVSLFGTAGDLRNLPLYWDDIRGEGKMKQVAQVVNEITEGGQGAKMHSDGTQRHVKTWQTAVCVTSNESLFDLVMRASKTDTAQVDRIFQIPVADPEPNGPGRLEEWVATPIFAALHDNYGMMGHKYAQMLGTGYEKMLDMVRKEQAFIGKEVGNRPNERFWLALCACLVVGADLANACGATFNVSELYSFLIEEYQSLRKYVASADLQGGTEANTASAMQQFFKMMGEHTIRTNDVAKQGRFSKVGYVQGPQRKDTPIHVHWALKRRLCRFSKKALTDWLVENGYTPSLVIGGLVKHYKATESKVNLAAGTNHGNATREAVFTIPVPHGSWLEETMDAYSPSAVAGLEEEEDGPEGHSVGE